MTTLGAVPACGDRRIIVLPPCQRGNCNRLSTGLRKRFTSIPLMQTKKSLLARRPLNAGITRPGMLMIQWRFWGAKYVRMPEFVGPCPMRFLKNWSVNTKDILAGTFNCITTTWRPWCCSDYRRTGPGKKQDPSQNCLQLEKT